MSALPEWNGGRPGIPMIMEPWDKDDQGLPIEPGQRLRIRATDGQTMLFDREHLVRALARLETHKPQEERRLWCGTCGHHVEQEVAEQWINR